MVTWVHDTTGRFARRPHYAATELDRACETLVLDFLQARHGEAAFPLTTDDLTVLMDAHTSAVDHYADLSAEDDEVEGMTTFLRDAAPEIAIAAHLASDPRRSNRLRTTLAHELGHAVFHRVLYDDLFAGDHQIPPRDPATRATSIRTTSTRAAVIGAREVDWMEWQAGYASGAFLMPRSALSRLVADFCSAEEVYAAVPLDTPLALALQHKVMAGFEVSEEAARVRLHKLGFLTREGRCTSLFG